MTMLPLSVLDLSFVTSGTPPSAALRNSLDLACHADALGYTRYWLAEHHNLPSVASPAPEIMIGQIAAATKRIRVGSGGVMLPNHAPLVVASAIWPIMISVAGLATEGRLWCSASQ